MIPPFFSPINPYTIIIPTNNILISIFQPLFVIINSYTTGLAPSVLGYMLHLLVAEKYGGKVTWDELGLPVTETGLALPCGATGRWFSE